MRLTDLDLLARHVEEPVDLFRIVKGATRGAPGVLDSLRSNYERDAPPRGVERQSALIHFGLSMFVSFEAAADRARRWPVLGAHVAHIRSSPPTGSTSPRPARGFTGRYGVGRCSCWLASPISFP